MSLNENVPVWGDNIQHHRPCCAFSFYDAVLYSSAKKRSRHNRGSDSAAYGVGRIYMFTGSVQDALCSCNEFPGSADTALPL